MNTKRSDVMLAVISIAVAAMGLFLCLKASAAELRGFGELGGAVFEKPPSKLWWQDGYANEFENQSLFFRVGAEVGGSNFAVRASYFDLGGYSLDAMATNDEHCYDMHGASPVCPDPTRFVTSGTLRGFAFSVIAKTSGAVRYYAEAGRTHYRQSFTMESGNDSYAERLWGHGWMAGVGLELKKGGTAGLSIYEGDVGSGFDDDGFPSGVGRAYVFSVGMVL